MDLGAVITDFATKLSRILNRKDSRLLLLEQMPRHAICAEIGVWKGEFSDRIIHITSPKKLHLIDPWEFQGEFPGRMYGGTVAKSQKDMDLIYESVKRRFIDAPSVVFNRGKSESVLSDFADGYFDWVYIDGNHYYEYVLKDLELCSRKVRTGGIIAGDDYTWGKEDGFPVKKAVQDFVNKKGFQNKIKVIGSQFIIRL